MNTNEYFNQMKMGYPIYMAKHQNENEDYIKRDFDRKVLKGLVKPALDIHCTKEELVKFICTMTDTDYAEGMQLEYLQPQLYRQYFLAIDYDTDKQQAIVKEADKVLYNLDKGTLSVEDKSGQWGRKKDRVLTIATKKVKEALGIEADKELPWYDLVAETAV